MTTCFRNMFNRGPMPLLEKVVQFTEQRQKVLAHNIANVDTPFYKTRDLDVPGFQRMIRDAIDRRRAGGRREIGFRSTRDLRIGANGSLQARPTQIRGANILFHDQNNRNMEEEMSELAKNQMMHNMAIALLREQFGVLKTAIRGRL
jgi:flagellar basal-body rod protein FlgB